MTLAAQGGIARLRRALGWTQKELASRSGRSLPLIKKLEQGTVRLTERTRAVLLRTFAKPRRGVAGAA
jgi:predicted transcriptional regulator